MKMYAITAAVAMGLFTVLVSVSAFAQEKKHEFVGNTQCKLCHNKPSEGAQWTVWKKMAHANAFKVLSSEKAVALGKELGLEKLPAESADCLKCHVTGIDKSTLATPAKIKKEEGVQCESCHGPSSGHLVDGKAIRMKKATDVDILANIIRPDKTTCMKCHNSDNPTWDPEKYTLEDGKKVGFDYKQAYEKIAHANPKKALAKKKQAD